MRFLVLAFCMLNLVTLPQDSPSLLTDSEKAYCTQTAKEIANKCNYSFEQNSLMLNFLYHMCHFAQLDEVFRKSVNLCIHQLIKTQDTPDLEQSFVEERMSKLFGQTIVLARRRLLHYQTWQLLDVQIEKDPEILTIINSLRDASGYLINEYAQRCTHDIDQMIKQKQATLKYSIGNTHVATRTLDILINQPELMCNQSSNDIDLQKINILYGLSSTISKEVDTLLKTKENCMYYAFSIQMVATELFKQCYQELYDKTTYDFPDSTIESVVAIDGTLRKVDDVLQDNSEDH